MDSDGVHHSVVGGMVAFGLLSTGEGVAVRGD